MIIKIAECVVGMGFGASQSERQIAELKETSRMQRKQTSLSNVTSGWVDTDAGDIVPFESIGPAYERLAKNQNFGAAVRGGARLLDVSASTLGKILRQKPLFRIGIFLYIVFVHMFLWLLISRLQVSDGICATTLLFNL